MDGFWTDFAWVLDGFWTYFGRNFVTGWISEGLRTDFGRIFDICILGEIDFRCILNGFAWVFWMDFGLILDGFRT